MTQQHAVHIVGGGWAGLATAVQLCENGIPPLLIEASRQLGGTTRRIAFDGAPVEQSPVMLFAGYHHVMHLFRLLKIRENQHYIRIPFDIILRRKRRTKFRFRQHALPAPYGVISGLLLARGLSWSDKMAVLRLLRAVRGNSTRPEQDMPVNELLHQQKQGERAIRFFWRPLCRMFLHCDTQRASTLAFLDMLDWLFLSDQGNSDVLQLKTDIGGIFTDRAMDFIEQKGGAVKLGHQVTGLQVAGDRLLGLRTDDSELAADKVVLAAGAAGSAALLTDLVAMRDPLAAFAQLTFPALATVYVKYPRQTLLPSPLLHTMGTLGQWLVDKRLQGLPGTMAVHALEKPQQPLPQDDELLTMQIVTQLHVLFPHWRMPLTSQVARTPAALLAATVHYRQHQPAAATPITGLWLAGDFVRHGPLPSLESAVACGLACADAVANSVSDPTPP